MQTPDKYKYTFTVFTPTLNRKNTLSRVYNSLCLQTFEDFEWLIVDDGSVDGTREMIARWTAEAEFPIRYYWQENQGKHIAFNSGVNLAQGRLFLTLDSDDGCVPEALAKFILYWNAIPENDRDNYSAVTALCQDETGKLVGDRFPQNILDADSLELRYRYKIRGEKWGFQRTDILAKYPFPCIAGSKFVPEGIVWSAISRHYKTRFINELLRIYYRNNSTDSQEKLTTSGSPGKHANSLMYWHGTILTNEIGWFWHKPLHFVRSAIHYCRFTFHQKSSISAAIKKLEVPSAMLLCIMVLPASWFVYCRDLRLDKKTMIKSSE